MKKLFISLLILLIPLNISALELSSKRYLIYDLDNNEMLEKDGIYDNISIASLTKIMVATVILDGVDDLNKEVKYTKKMYNAVPEYAYMIGLVINQKYTYEDLLYAMLMPSAADATMALALSYSSSEEEFVSAMNKKAKELGLKDTYFTNPVGMDNKDNKMTLNDLLTLLKYALNNKTFKSIYTCKKYKLPDGNVLGTSIARYTSKLGLDISRIEGAKTGFTDNTGYALSQIFHSNNHLVLSITQGAPISDNAYHIRDGLKIIEYMDDTYDNITIYEKGYILKEIEIKDALIKKYKIKLDNDIIKYISKYYDKNKLRIEYNLNNNITYKSKGNIGNIKFYYDDRLLYNMEVIKKHKSFPSIIVIIKKIVLLTIIILISYFALGYLKYYLEKKYKIKFKKLKMRKHK